MSNRSRSPLAARSKTWVCGRSLAGIAGSNPSRGMDVSFVCCQIEVSAKGRSLVHGSPIECDVHECDH